MYTNSTISWESNIGTYFVNLYLVNHSGVTSTLITHHSGAVPFHFFPTGLGLGEYSARAVLIDCPPAFSFLKGKVMTSSKASLAYQ